MALLIDPVLGKDAAQINLPGLGGAISLLARTAD
jgi:hypothetical protein